MYTSPRFHVGQNACRKNHNKSKKQKDHRVRGLNVWRNILEKWYLVYQKIHLVYRIIPYLGMKSYEPDALPGTRCEYSYAAPKRVAHRTISYASTFIGIYRKIKNKTHLEQQKYPDVPVWHMMAYAVLSCISELFGIWIYIDCTKYTIVVILRISDYWIFKYQTVPGTKYSGGIRIVVPSDTHRNVYHTVKFHMLNIIGTHRKTPKQTFGATTYLAQVMTKTFRPRVQLYA